MDVLTPKQRRRNMQAIRSSGSRAELIVRRLVHSMGYRYRLHRSDLPGTPDLVLPRHRKIIFVHGCFWHRHPRCRYAYTPGSNVAFWKKKFNENVARDRRVSRELQRMGWKVIIVWECQCRDPDKLAERLATALDT
ncbi:MAG: DNA mismatch endonuclease Vsr [Phycisphaeraceae bacterium]|nr:MAG: DNA mismatch endonuclease Vsr [Phycisphaeraceae bacterium]